MDSVHLSETKLSYIKEHPTESPYAMARKLGCSVQTIYCQLHRMFGNSVIKDKQAIRDHRKVIVGELYPTHSASEIAVMLGITKAAVNGIARRIGVRHTEETTKRITMDCVSKALAPDVQARRLNKLKRTIRMDQFRILSGKKQMTKRKFKQANNKELCTKHYLIRKYNYFCDKSIKETLTLFFDSQTKRLPPDREQYYSDKYHLIFKQADD